MKKIFPFFKGPRKGASLHVPQRMGPLWKQTPISRALLSISFGVRSKGALPPDSLHRAPLERDVPLLELSFIHLLKSPVYEPPSTFPSAAPMEEDARLPSVCYISSSVSSNGVPSPGSSHRAPIERDARFHSPPSTIYQEFPVNGPP